MKDELLKLENYQLPLNLIVGSKNSSDSDKFNHWVLCYIDRVCKTNSIEQSDDKDNTDNVDQRPNKIFYSSFGDTIPLEIKEFLKPPILSSDFQIQKFNNSDCGLYCIVILYLLNNGVKFEDIILEFVEV